MSHTHERITHQPPKAPDPARQWGRLTLPPDRPFLIAGPVRDRIRGAHAEMAARIREIAARAGLPFIFKASFDKANRTSIHSYRGPGLKEGLRILARVKAELGLPILTDYPRADSGRRVAEVADVLQVPAFLCRQTDLIVAGVKTGAWSTSRKGQFVAPWDLEHSVIKAREAGGRADLGDRARRQLRLQQPGEPQKVGVFLRHREETGGVCGFRINGRVFFYIVSTPNYEKKTALVRDTGCCSW